METLFKWLLDLPRAFADVGNWLITPLPYINLAPLGVIGIGGLTAIVAIKVVRLFVGG